MTAQTMKLIRAAYQTAADNAASVIASGALEGKSALTQDTIAKLEAELQAGIALIDKAIKDNVPDLMAQGLASYADVDIRFMTDALGNAAGQKITIQGLKDLYSNVNSQVVSITLNRVFQNGYDFAASAGRVALRFDTDIKNLIAAGLAQNRDLGKIAGDITKYVKTGKQQMVHRWGDKIEPDSKALLRRVPERVDYRALRIARSELSMSLQEAGKENGRLNPGASGWYDWVRVNSVDHGCICPRNATNSPYRYEEVPPFDHPNCMCVVRTRLLDVSEFTADLRDWVGGGENPRLDTWYSSVYLPGQNAA
jgi:hypothetical protein